MSFLSGRSGQRQTQLVRFEGELDSDGAQQGDATVMLRFDNYQLDQATATPIGDVSAIGTGTGEGAPNARILVRPYAGAAPTDAGVLSVTSDGRVGVGTASPERVLDVRGDAAFSSLHSDTLFSKYARIGDVLLSSGVDVDVVGDVACRAAKTRRLISSLHAGSDSNVLPSIAASAGTGAGDFADVSVSGTDASGVISVVMGELVNLRPRPPLVRLALVTLGQPMPCAVCLTAHDESAAALGVAVFAQPTLVGFDLLIPRDALVRLASGCLYRWSYVSAAIPRPSNQAHGTSTPQANASPVVRVGESVNSDGAARIIGTDVAGIVQVNFGAREPFIGPAPEGVSHAASIKFGSPSQDTAVPIILLSAWSDNAALIAQRKPPCATASESGDGFDIYIGGMDERSYIPYAVYTWSYYVLHSSSKANTDAGAHADLAAGDNATAHVRLRDQELGGGAGELVLVTGDPPSADMNASPTVPIASVTGIPGVLAGAPVCIVPGNAVAADLARHIAAVPVTDGFQLRVPSIPPQAPLWPHTLYKWYFSAVGIPRPPPTTPTVWFSYGTGFGGAVRVVGTDMAGSFDIVFGNAPRSLSWRLLGVATVVFSLRYTHPVTVQLTCSGHPELGPVPPLVVKPCKHGSGFQVCVKATDRRKLLQHVRYQWSYLVVGAASSVVT